MVKILLLVICIPIFFSCQPVVEEEYKGKGEEESVPVITLLGEEIITIKMGEERYFGGATAFDKEEGDITSRIEVSGDLVDVNVPGIYEIKYSVIDLAGNVSKVLIRTIIVIDPALPVITIDESGAPSSIEFRVESYVPAIIIAIDNTGADISGNIETIITLNNNIVSTVDPNIVGVYTVTYNIKDSMGHEASKARTISVADTNPPEILLNGNDTIILVENTDAYTELNAIATDNGLTVTSSIIISGNPNPASIGNYTVTYSITDGFSHTASVTRLVKVVAPPTITVNPASNETIELRSAPYTDAGATVRYYDKGSADYVNLNISGTGTVNTNAVGQYTISYNFTYNIYLAAEQTRTVNVTDTIPPTLTLNGTAEVLLVKGYNNYTELNATAVDNGTTEDISITGSVNSSVVGNYTITYSVSDSYNTTTVTRSVKVVDPPIITLTGTDEIVEGGATYNDAGATVTYYDEFTNNIIYNEPIENTLITALCDETTINTNKLCTYTIVYTFDKQNAANGVPANSISRTVEIVDTTPPEITLDASARDKMEFSNSGLPLQYFDDRVVYSKVFPIIDSTFYNSSYLHVETQPIDGTINLNAEITPGLNTSCTNNSDDGGITCTNIPLSVGGQYVITYIVTDKSGNTSTTSRVITVDYCHVAPDGDSRNENYLYANGDGYSNTINYICTENQLQAISQNPSYAFRLEKDITLTTTNWTPIGNLTTPFTGTFDGNYHKIKNLSINRSDDDYQGLFGLIRAATVSNVGIEDLSIIGRHYVGGIIGRAINSQITNSYTISTTTSTISGDQASIIAHGTRIGGIVGSLEGPKGPAGSAPIVNEKDLIIDTIENSTNGSTLKNCYSNIYIHYYFSTNDNVGGLVGYLYSLGSTDMVKILNSYTDSYSLMSTNKVGRLVGWLYQNGYTTTPNIQNSFATEGLLMGTYDKRSTAAYTFSILNPNTPEGIVGQYWGAFNEFTITNVSSSNSDSLYYNTDTNPLKIGDFNNDWRLNSNALPTLRGFE